MGKNTLKRSLIVGIVFLFLSTTCIPVLASEGKPDLIVENITIEPGSMIFTEVCYCTIKNIGDAPTGDVIEVKLIVKRKPFGIFPPLFTVYTGSGEHYIGGPLNPGVSTQLTLVDCELLPTFGFFQFKCIVNPGLKIEESDYDNNDHSQNFFTAFGIWI